MTSYRIFTAISLVLLMTCVTASADDHATFVIENNTDFEFTVDVIDQEGVSGSLDNCPKVTKQSDACKVNLDLHFSSFFLNQESKRYQMNLNGVGNAPNAVIVLFGTAWSGEFPSGVVRPPNHCNYTEGPLGDNYAIFGGTASSEWGGMNGNLKKDCHTDPPTYTAIFELAPSGD